MKKIFVSMGLAAAGTAGLHAAYGPDIRGDASKIWNVSATLRGFYDDNYLTRHKKHGSVGLEVSPTLQINVPLQQTEIGVKYTYGMYYYQKRESNRQSAFDQTHEFDLWLDHAFSPRWEARAQDTVLVAQEPNLVGTGAVATAVRTSQNYLANTAQLSLHTIWTRLLSTQLSYGNTFVSYENHGATVAGLLAGQQASYSGRLDRVDQHAALDVEWQVRPETVGFVGYQIGLANFTGNEPIAVYTPAQRVYYSDNRDNISHYGYVGVQHHFMENLTGKASVGVQYTDYYNDPSASSSLGPYATGSLVYNYAPGSYAQVGVTHSRNATDNTTLDGSGHLTLDQESTVVYASINHPITARLVGSVVGRFQHSTYNGGLYNNISADFYNVGVNLAYNFNRNFSTEVGYNFDYYTTPVPLQGYSRNRVYLGVSASY